MVGEEPGRLLAQLAHLRNLRGKTKNMLRCIFSVSFSGSESTSSHPIGRSVRFRGRLEKLKPRSWVNRRLEVCGAEGHAPHSAPITLLGSYLLCSSSAIRWHHLQSKSRVGHAQNFELAQTGVTGIKIFHGICACDELYEPEPRTALSAGSISPQLPRTLMRRLT